MIIQKTWAHESFNESRFEIRLFSTLITGVAKEAWTVFTIDKSNVPVNALVAMQGYLHTILSEFLTR